MLYICELDVGGIVPSSGARTLLQSVTVMRSGSPGDRIQFQRSGQPVLVADFGTTAGALFVEVKDTTAFDGDPLNAATTFVEDATNKWYTFALKLITATLDARFMVDGDPANDVAQLPLHMGFGYVPTGETVPVSFFNLGLIVINNVARGAGGGGALAGPTYQDTLALHSVLSLPGVSDYTGGGSTKLDGWQLTAGLSLPRNYFFDHPSLGRQYYKLRAGTDAEDSPGTIRPDDFDGTSNQCIYEKTG